LFQKTIDGPKNHNCPKNFWTSQIQFYVPNSLLINCNNIFVGKKPLEKIPTNDTLKIIIRIFTWNKILFRIKSFCCLNLFFPESLEAGVPLGSSISSFSSFFYKIIN
jgi:hypothetical protein